MGKINKFLVYGLMALVLPLMVHAHLVGGSGVGSGLMHPLSGFDHLLAMVAVGVISAQFGGRLIWIVPAVFVLFMVIGGMLGLGGFMLPAVETTIALSVLLLGTAIAFNKRIPVWIVLACVAFFALSHGHAHGEEVPLIASPLLYVLGFVLSTSILHITGVLIGQEARRTELSMRLVRYAGALTAVIGLSFLIW